MTKIVTYEYFYMVLLCCLKVQLSLQLYGCIEMLSFAIKELVIGVMWQIHLQHSLLSFTTYDNIQQIGIKPKRYLYSLLSFFVGIVKKCDIQGDQVKKV